MTVGVGGRGDGVTWPPRLTLLLPPSSSHRLSFFARTPGLLFPTFFHFGCHKMQIKGGKTPAIVCNLVDLHKCNGEERENAIKIKKQVREGYWSHEKGGWEDSTSDQRCRWGVTSMGKVLPPWHWAPSHPTRSRLTQPIRPEGPRRLLQPIGAQNGLPYSVTWTYFCWTYSMTSSLSSLGCAQRFPLEVLQRYPPPS